MDLTPLFPLASVGATLASPPAWLLLPFLLLLALIALAPLSFPHFWEKWYPHLSLALGLFVALYYTLLLQRPQPLLHAAEEYLSFLALVGSLFLVSSGILLRLRGPATPLTNCLFLFLGALLSNLFGTTGASMCLIRPWLRINQHRLQPLHLVFFIFLISNLGGSLTPIGDPPLFLGYLKGVPFWWNLQHCWAPWIFSVGTLLLLFFLLDLRALRALPPHRLPTPEPYADLPPFQLEGTPNLLLLAAIVACVFLPFGWREAGMLAAALLSWFTTPKRIHSANHFNFEPLKEVAWLFIGIFLTMIPALEILAQSAPSLRLHSPVAFFWSTGALSGFLDNAPTYAAFLAAAFGVLGLQLDHQMPLFLQQHSPLLVSISLGAAYFGAMTYIGNIPNLMVKKIAEQQQAPCPSFLAYLLRFSLPILLPLFLLLQLLFLSH